MLLHLANHYPTVCAVVMAAKVTIAKYEGDDRYSWAVFVNGRPVVTGCARSEAQYHRDQIKKKESAVNDGAS